MLVQVMSVVDNVTSTVPLPVMLLTNAIRAGHLPDGVAVIQVMPCTETRAAPAGQRIFSLWQGATLEEIAAAVEGIVGDHCTSTLFPVMEDFAHGVDREQLTDAAMRVARRTGAKLIEMDEKIGPTKTVTATATTISAKVNEQTAPVLEKVQQNETVQKVTDAIAAAAAAVNQKFAEGFGWVHAKLNPPAKVNAPEQVSYRPAEAIWGGERRGEGDEGSDARAPKEAPPNETDAELRPFRVEAEAAPAAEDAARDPRQGRRDAETAPPTERQREGCLTTRLLSRKPWCVGLAYVRRRGRRRRLEPMASRSFPALGPGPREKSGISPAPSFHRTLASLAAAPTSRRTPPPASACAPRRRSDPRARACLAPSPRAAASARGRRRARRTLRRRVGGFADALALEADGCEKRDAYAARARPRAW